MIRNFNTIDVTLRICLATPKSLSGLEIEVKNSLYTIYIRVWELITFIYNDWFLPYFFNKVKVKDNIYI